MSAKETESLLGGTIKLTKGESSTWFDITKEDENTKSLTKKKSG
jgi:hypothetical protein